MTKKNRIKLIENNLVEGIARFNRKEINLETWVTIQRDARKRITEIRNEKKN